MRAANQCCAALDAPSTSGRCVFPHSRVPGPQRQRHRTWQLRAGGNTSTHNELELHGAQPLPGFKPPPPAGVVPGARTTATPLLSPDRVVQLLAEAAHPHALQHYGAFYSSDLGGIVTNPAYMVVPIDDHMVHKGDAVVEEVQLVEGYLYQLDARLARFMESAELAGLPLPLTEARLRRVLLDTAAASLKMHGVLTFWLSRGRGGFAFNESVGPSLYALLCTDTVYAEQPREAGFKAYSSPLAPRSPYFTSMRNVSQVESAVAHYEALARGGDLAVFTDADDIVLYGSSCTIGLLTRDHTLVLPPDEGGAATFAAQTIAAHVMEYVSAEDEPDLTVAQVERRFFSTAELQDAREGFAISTRLGVVGLSHFDDAPLGRGTEWEGTSGPVSLALNELLVVQRAYKQGSAEHTEVPYGYLTGMKSQLH